MKTFLFSALPLSALSVALLSACQAVESENPATKSAGSQSRDTSFDGLACTDKLEIIGAINIPAVAGNTDSVVVQKLLSKFIRPIPIADGDPTHPSYDTFGNLEEKEARLPGQHYTLDKYYPKADAIYISTDPSMSQSGSIVVANVSKRGGSYGPDLFRLTPTETNDPDPYNRKLVKFANKGKLKDHTLWYDVGYNKFSLLSPNGDSSINPHDGGSASKNFLGDPEKKYYSRLYYFIKKDGKFCYSTVANRGVRFNLAPHSEIYPYNPEKINPFPKMECRGIQKDSRSVSFLALKRLSKPLKLKELFIPAIPATSDRPRVISTTGYEVWSLRADGYYNKYKYFRLDSYYDARLCYTRSNDEPHECLTGMTNGWKKVGNGNADASNELISAFFVMPLDPTPNRKTRFGGLYFNPYQATWDSKNPENYCVPDAIFTTESLRKRERIPANLIRKYAKTEEVIELFREY